ncbi:alpha/beta fold hydrolase [Ruegeria lacuscaerulensis]|uniref:alpha/beta fold hydrolase n=1 Tax=Ruegeria lacuscaerulensis TaxID=55218 RepID=UPI0014798E18|nr:alpha/beta hydrolase [Ruegeria lacuscaerulensis]
MRSSHSSDPAEPLNVIFVHGWACGWQDWSGVTSLLPDSVHIGLAKLPGSPEAVSLEGETSLSGCAAHVIALANDLGFDRFVLVGHSMGARIAIELAANWQRRVSHLLLLDGSNVPEDSDESVSRLAEQLAQLGQQGWAEATFEMMMLDNLGREEMRNLVNRAAQYPADVLMAYYHAMATWDRDNFAAAIDRLSCPVTIMQSTSLDEHEVRRPVMTHPSSLWLDALRARVAGAEIKLVPNTGHFLMLEQPHLIADWVQEILQVEHGVHNE